MTAPRGKVESSLAERGRPAMWANEPAAYSAAGLASRWGCSPGHIYGMVRGGELTSFRIGTLIRIAAQEVARIEGCNGGSSSTEVNGALSGGKGEQPGGTHYIRPIEGQRNAG